jgi:hypothetical protein
MYNEVSRNTLPPKSSSLSANTGLIMSMAWQKICNARIKKRQEFGGIFQYN